MADMEKYQYQVKSKINKNFKKQHEQQQHYY